MSEHNPDDTDDEPDEITITRHKINKEDTIENGEIVASHVTSGGAPLYVWVARSADDE